MKRDDDVVVEFNELMAICVYDNNMPDSKALNFARPEMLKRMVRAGEERHDAVMRFKNLTKHKPE